MELLARRTVQELEGDEGQKHLDEYADASTERGKCMLETICKKIWFPFFGLSVDRRPAGGHRHRSRVCVHLLLDRQGMIFTGGRNRRVLRTQGWQAQDSVRPFQNNRKAWSMR